MDILEKTNERINNDLNVRKIGKIGRIVYEIGTIDNDTYNVGIDNGTIHDIDTRRIDYDEVEVDKAIGNIVDIKANYVVVRIAISHDYYYNPRIDDANVDNV